jgi:hypothetical protein
MLWDESIVSQHVSRNFSLGFGFGRSDRDALRVTRESRILELEFDSKINLGRDIIDPIFCPCTRPIDPRLLRREKPAREVGRADYATLLIACIADRWRYVFCRRCAEAISDCAISPYL